MAGGIDLHDNALALHDALAILLVDLGLALLQLPQGIRLRYDAAGETPSPEAEGLGLQPLGALPLADAGGVEYGAGVAGEVARVAELAADGGVAQDGVAALGVGGEGGGLEVLNVLADAHEFADEAKLLLGGGPGGDGGGGAVGAGEVPGVEAGKVLDRAEDLVAADGRGDELEVVGYRRVVDDGVGDHDCCFFFLLPSGWCR